jgi:Domain of unknown function (DUF4340)
MFKKLNTTTLLILLALLGGIVLFNKFYQDQKNESTFRDIFVNIDTSAVNTILIYPHSEKGKELKISRNGKRWDLQSDKLKTLADPVAVQELLSQFAEMKSLSLGGQDKSSWKDLQVSDTAGSRVKMITSNNKTYDMIVGKIGYTPSTRNGLTYIRHAQEEATYAVPGFLSFSINQGFNSWRNRLFLKGNTNNYTTLTFTYPGDSSFVLNKSGNLWLLNGEKADSAQTNAFINQLDNLQGNGFVDSYMPSAAPVFSLSVNGTNQVSPIKLQAYSADSTRKYILHSSLNPDAYFSESESNLLHRVFAGKAKFFKPDGKSAGK